jgi:hypothetical protein
MFIFKKPRKTATLAKGNTWKITYRIREDELSDYEPRPAQAVDWIPNNVDGYVIDFNTIPVAGGYFIEITAIENNTQY